MPPRNYRTRMHRALDRMIDAVPPNISKGAQAMATRINNAEAAFIETLMRIGKISRPDAEKAMRTMLKLKVAKLDAVSGAIRVKHGAYLEPDAIRNAVAYDARAADYDPYAKRDLIRQATTSKARREQEERKQELAMKRNAEKIGLRYDVPAKYANDPAFKKKSGRDARFDWEAHNDRDRVESENARTPDMHQRAIRYHEDLADRASNGAAASAHQNAASLHAVAATSSYGRGQHNPQAILAARGASARANRMNISAHGER